ncbi:hypothetical protein SAMN05421493_11133 [Pseudobutyrivibrio sp. 49]|nr:hypothetical protein SAMN05421493_11133 [Pseudobutyrivibrio sp. 49]SFN84461.1 hypothetical protein SAMN04487831_10481 [Pseudobutyrivibrio sp. UC1225]
MKCPCCGNEVCAFNALLEYMVEQEEASTEEKSENTKKSQ